jgi:hypothetical protein
MPTFEGASYYEDFYYATVLLALLMSLALVGCGGGGGGSSTITTTAPVAPAPYNALVGNYIATWTQPGSSATGTFEVNIGYGPTPLEPPDQSSNSLYLTTTGSLPPVSQTGTNELNCVADTSPESENFQLNAAGKAIIGVEFGSWPFNIESDGDEYGYNIAMVDLTISSSGAITGKLIVPAAYNEITAAPYFNLTLKPREL